MNMMKITFDLGVWSPEWALLLSPLSAPGHRDGELVGSSLRGRLWRPAERSATAIGNLHADDKYLDLT